jgi:outer membrane autotransporter protein
LPVVAPGGAPIPLFRPEVSVQSVVPAVARTLVQLTLGTFNERQGTQSLLNDDVSPAAWGRVFGQSSREQFAQGIGVAPSFDGTFSGLQVGRDVLKFDSLNGHHDHIGLYFGYAHVEGGVHGFVDGFQNAPAGQVALDAESVGGYWTHIGPSNWYVDTIVQGTKISGLPQSDRGIGVNLRGSGVAASIEGGYPIPLTPWLMIEPQTQGIWQHLSIDGTADQFSTIMFNGSDVFTGRVGGLLKGTFGSPGAFWQPYLKGNAWWGSSGNDIVTFAANDIPTGRNGGAALEAGGGIAGKLTQFASIYGDVSYLTSATGPRLTTIKGNIGLRVTW